MTPARAMAASVTEVAMVCLVFIGGFLSLARVCGRVHTNEAVGGIAMGCNPLVRLVRTVT